MLLLKKKNPLDFVLYESIFVVLIYWEICLRPGFQSRQTLYTLLCRICATLSCKAVVSWHPHHRSCHDNKNPYFYIFLPLIKRHNLLAISEPESRYCSPYFTREFSFPAAVPISQKHPYQTMPPRVMETLACVCKMPGAISRRVWGLCPQESDYPRAASAQAQQF